MELISIIVPVYNVEKYLNQCIESIAHQTYKNLEIILVDDGSTDNSPQICDAWKKKDNRIQVLHISNGGAGNARNKGFEIATGEWIAFIDSDDYLESNMLEYLHKMCDEDVDLVECCIIETYNDYAAFSEEDENLIKCSAEEALSYHIENKIFKQTPPNKLYRRSVVEDIPFPIGKLIDDEFWTYQVIAKCNNLVHSSRRMYAYRQQEESVMHKKFSVRRLQAIDAKRERLRFIDIKFPKLKNVANVDLWKTCMYLGQMSLKNLEKRDLKIAISKIQDTMKEFPLSKPDILQLRFDYMIWAISFKISITMTCRIRNILRIGI